ncbi:MAG TPA: hypothetical protein VIK83_03865, partial [Coriobacteriia bacterium]
LEYRFTAHGQSVDNGRAALVKLMADPESATLVVNGCLFLNVLSFRYLTFETDDEGACTFELVGDGMRLILAPTADTEEAAASTSPRVARLIEAEAYDPDAYAMLEDEDDDEGR